MIAIDWSAYSRVVVLTGAGVSVASGLRPYRGPGGLWTEVEASGVADAAALRDRPAEVWRFFAAARQAVLAARPNAAHLALARLEQGVTGRGGRFTLITQNVDGLHQRAGSQAVLEIHGTLARSRCTRVECTQPAFADERVDESCPPCPRCGQPLRPDVVLFGEPLPVEAEHLAKRALRDCDFFLAVGTSGTVTPAASFVRWAEVNGARTLLVNLEPMSPPNPAFQQELLGRAEELLPELVG
jgi:NAD-dependent deacetylase